MEAASLQGVLSFVVNLLQTNSCLPGHQVLGSCIGVARVPEQQHLVRSCLLPQLKHTLCLGMSGVVCWEPSPCL